MNNQTEPGTEPIDKDLMEFPNPQKARMGIEPYVINKTELPSRYKKIYLECMGHYQQIYQHRMR